MGFFIPQFKMPWLLVVGVILLITTIATIYFYENPDPDKATECKVLQGYITSAAEKVQAKFILILEDPKHRQFEMPVTPLIYYKATKNKHIGLMLSEHDITKKGSCNIIPLLIIMAWIVFAVWVFYKLVD